MTTSLARFKAFLFDLDGTLAYPSGAVPGAAELIRALKGRGKGVAVVTNNSRLSRRELNAALRRYSIRLDEKEVITAVTATARFIAGRQPGGRVLVVGSAGLRAELAAHGLTLVDGPPADYVVAGVDPRLTYRKLARAVDALLGGAAFVAVNVDRFIPTAGGGRLPGAALVVGALEAVAGRPPDAVVGKPGPGLILEACRTLGVAPEEAILVGDSLITDLPAARAAGTAFALVLSGVSSRAELGGADGPDYVFEKLTDILAAPAG